MTCLAWELLAHHQRCYILQSNKYRCENVQTGHVSIYAFSSTRPPIIHATSFEPNQHPFDIVQQAPKLRIPNAVISRWESHRKRTTPKYERHPANKTLNNNNNTETSIKRIGMGRVTHQVPLFFLLSFFLWKGPNFTNCSRLM